MPDRYDVAVVGGGTAGITAAQVARHAGRSVLLVSEGPLGGECTWNGCVPSKALIEAARLRHLAGIATDRGVDVGDVRVRFDRVMQRVRDVINQIASYEDAAHLEGAGITVRRGRARLGADHSLDVDGVSVEASRVILCTGSRPSIPPVAGLATVPHLTNENLFELTSAPRQMLVMGAGPIGLEMAQAFARLGTPVHVVDVASSLLPREDPTVAALARDLLEADGVRFTLGARVVGVAHMGDEVTLTVDVAGQTQMLRGDALLVATGRQANVDDLGLEHAGVRVIRTGVVVDSRLRTSVHEVLAAGDVTGVLPFTHVAAYQGRIAGANAAGGRRTASYRVVPWVIFTDPEIAHVGLTEPEARRAHGDVRVATLPFTAVDRAVITGETRGLIKVITTGRPVVGHAGGGSILGAHIIGPNAGDLIHEFAIAMQLRAFGGRLAQTVHAYPTMSLGVQQAVAQLFETGRATAGALRDELEPLS